MSREVQLRRGTANEHTTFTGAEGEVTFDTTQKTLHVHDGVTPGGTVLAKKSEIPEMANIVKSGMPSTRVESLTLVAGVETNFIAPADGYFCLRASGANAIIELRNESRSSFGVRMSGSYAMGYIPVQRGDKVMMSSTTTPQFCRFFYATGTTN